MQIFAAPAGLLAINTVDPQERLARIAVLASLIEDFSIEPVYAGDAFLGIRDALPPIRAEVAIA
jgi:hypothetical protein